MRRATKSTQVGGSFPAHTHTPPPENSRYAELLFDLPEALMHHYMIALPFTRVNVYITLSNMSTFATLPPPSETRGKKDFDDSLELP